MTETQVAEVRKDHSALLQAFIDLGNEVLGMREEYRKALEQVDAVRTTLAAVQRERDEARASGVRIFDALTEKERRIEAAVDYLRKYGEGSGFEQVIIGMLAEGKVVSP